MSLSWKHINGLKQMKAIVALVVILLSCIAETGTLRVMNYNVSNNPDNATEDQSFRTVFEAVGTENVSGTAKRIDLLAIAETDTGSSARLPLITAVPLRSK